MEAPGPSAMAGIPGPRLVPFAFWQPLESIRPDPPRLQDLRRAMELHLAELGFPGAEPLRWAITAVEPERGLRIEGIGLSADPAASDGAER